MNLSKKFQFISTYELSKFFARSFYATMIIMLSFSLAQVKRALQSAKIWDMEKVDYLDKDNVTTQTLLIFILISLFDLKFPDND